MEIITQQLILITTCTRDAIVLTAKKGITQNRLKMLKLRFDQICTFIRRRSKINGESRI